MTKMARDVLIQKVTELRANGLRPKAIARELGYACGYIRNVIWQLRKGDKNHIDPASPIALQELRDPSP